MAAYYNEFDPKAAAWLRELIKQGHIAPGDVDERSISDVTPDDLRGYTQCHFFAGIGVWSYALRQAGWPDDRPVWTGSCPCQPFSSAGKRKGTSDERHLWPHWFHLISQCRPVEVFGEQVASKDGRAWFDTVQADMEALGFAVGAADLCAAGVGAPHIRQRLWFYGTVADADGVRCTRISREGQKGIAEHSATQRMADDQLQQRQGGATSDNEARGRDEEPATLAGLGGTQRMGDSIGGGRQQQSNGRGSDGAGVGSTGREQKQSGKASGSTQRMADDTSGGRRQERQDNRRCDEGDRTQGFTARPTGERSNNTAYPTNGFWRDADWLGCRDGKFRPVEPGTSPLVNGAAARVGRLRGYGNAIVAQVAQTFIEATQGW